MFCCLLYDDIMMNPLKTMTSCTRLSHNDKSDSHLALIQMLNQIQPLQTGSFNGKLWSMNWEFSGMIPMSLKVTVEWNVGDEPGMIFETITQKGS